VAAQPAKADYGLDAPGVVVGTAVAGAAALAGAGATGCRRRCWAAGWPSGACLPSPKPDSWSAAAEPASLPSATGRTVDQDALAAVHAGGRVQRQLRGEVVGHQPDGLGRIDLRGTGTSSPAGRQMHSA
jgi:hypothetical protein